MVPQPDLNSNAKSDLSVRNETGLLFRDAFGWFVGIQPSETGGLKIPLAGGHIGIGVIWPKWIAPTRL
jgi:hypothetical protein